MIKITFPNKRSVFVNREHLPSALLEANGNDAKRAMVDRAMLENGKQVRVGNYLFELIPEWIVVANPGMENEFEAAKFHTTCDAYRFIDEQRDEGDDTVYDVMRLTVDGTLTTEF